MSQCRKNLISLTFLFIFASTTSSYAEEVIEDLSVPESKEKQSVPQEILDSLSAPE